MQTLIIKQVHVKSINVTITRFTKGIQRIEDMDTLFFIFLTFVLAKLFLVLPQSHLRWHCTDYSPFLFFLLLLNFCRLWLWQLNDTTTYFFKYNQVSGLVRSSQKKLSSGSESIPGRLLPVLVNQGVVRPGHHLVAAIWYWCSHLWLVRYFGVLNYWGFVTI